MMQAPLGSRHVRNVYLMMPKMERTIYLIGEDTNIIYFKFFGGYCPYFRWSLLVSNQLEKLEAA